MTSENTDLIKKLCSKTLMNQNWITTVIRKAPYSYKTYNILKKNGGSRTISQPSKELKLIQRILVDDVFSKFETHECAKAYISNTSIIDNAKPHLHSKYLCKYDFKDFFPSIKQSDLRNYLLKKSQIPKTDIEIITRICFKKDKNKMLEEGFLSIGAPSSPAISNILMHSFDKALHEKCTSINAKYTRYADDISISSKSFLKRDLIEEIIKLSISESDLSNRLKINIKKTTFLSKKQKRFITGINITPDEKLSIGREKKRLISSMIHKYTLSKFPNDELKKLAGHIAFAKNIEPDFYKLICKKYGIKAINEIRKKQ